MLFQSTHPRGVRRLFLCQSFAWRRVSIHAPAWGATSRKRSSVPRVSCFNPRTRVGCDASRWPGCVAISVSIHAPAWGATRQVLDAVNRLLEVSIHAPAWGATQCGAGRGGGKRVSIHAPAWGATLPRPRRSSNFSSFNPRTRVGCDQVCSLFGPGFHRFNPRTRVGCDPTEDDREHTTNVSIHAPAWGATPLADRYVGAQSGFNPRTRVGCDALPVRIR